MSKISYAVAALFAATMLAGCQSTGGSGSETATQASVEANTDASASEASGETVAQTAPAQETAQNAAAAPAQCAQQISGPPPKPAKGADFAKNAVGKNLARNVGRNVLGSMLGGGAVGGAVSSQVVRTEQDLKGTWNFTDGSPACGCEVSVSTGSGFTRVGVIRQSYTIKVASSGSMKNVSCTNGKLASVAAFGLGHSFTGYDAPLEIKDANGTTIASLTRDGINYFSGTLSDGTPVTMWRRGG